jgi:deoxyribodipyrimidine photolyase-related protein
VKNAKLIFPHQLFEDHPLFALDGPIFLIEEPLFFTQFAFHPIKIEYHRATMRTFEAHARERGQDVHCVTSDVRDLLVQLHAQGFTSVSMVDPVDDWLSRRVDASCKKLGLSLDILDSPMFLNSRADIAAYFHPSKKRYFQTDFYKRERIGRDILMNEDGSPAGGQWTYDIDNRKRYPKGKIPPKVVFPSPHRYPISYRESDAWLKQFLHQRLAEFGDYEDAIVRGELVLHHSLLTPMLNVGLLTPAQILRETLDFAAKHKVPLASLEGFIRQIIGWREFMRGVYVVKGRQERTRNFWGFTRKIPQSFYDGTTGIPPIDDTIRKVQETGYCHHIERLMVLGNFMMLCEFDPDDVYRWFMELFIDAYDWVMVPNVYGMSQFADGGILSTKPYISGSNYLMKMGDYPKGEWQTTWDALFWRFLDVHRDFFLKNPRMGMLIKTFDKMDESKKAGIREEAERWFEVLDA